MNAVLILVFCSAATLAQNAPGFTYITYITLVTLTLFVVTRLSCLCHQQERHAACPHYLTIERITLFPRMASSVAVVYLAPGTAAYSGHQTREPGRLLSPWMSGERPMSPGHQAVATPGHTLWEVTTAKV